MASTDAPEAIPAATLALPDGFHFNEADGNLGESGKAPFLRSPPVATLGVLSNFRGVFTGRGFNQIFRPNSAAPTTTNFPNPVTPAPPNPPSENVLELNLTKESLTFSASLGNVPNRGLEAQNDIFLNGVPYVQSISDVSNTATGKADGKAIGIHFEPGLWMHVPATTTDPVEGETLVRMASIPHGTTINASTSTPIVTVAGPPTIDSVDITPSVIQTGRPIRFASQTITDNSTPRLPQDLTKFIAAGTITQDILTDPNTVLRNAVKGQKITKTIVFQISTSSPQPGGGGTANIAFLQGNPTQNGPNADATLMTATFWIETVQHDLQIPKWKPGQPAFKITPHAPSPDALVPTFSIKPPHEITEPRTITVTTTQIQYSQKVNLNFAGLAWPHVSVATLVPQGPLGVPDSVWN